MSSFDIDNVIQAGILAKELKIFQKNKNHIRLEMPSMSSYVYGYPPYILDQRIDNIVIEDSHIQLNLSGLANLNLENGYTINQYLDRKCLQNVYLRSYKKISNKPKYNLDSNGTGLALIDLCYLTSGKAPSKTQFTGQLQIYNPSNGVSRGGQPPKWSIIGYMVVMCKDAIPYGLCNLMLVPEDDSRDANTGFLPFFGSTNIIEKNTLLTYRGNWNGTGLAEINCFDPTISHGWRNQVLFMFWCNFIDFNLDPASYYSFECLHGGGEIFGQGFDNFKKRHTFAYISDDNKKWTYTNKTNSSVGLSKLYENALTTIYNNPDQYASIESITQFIKSVPPCNYNDYCYELPVKSKSWIFNDDISKKFDTQQPVLKQPVLDAEGKPVLNEKGNPILDNPDLNEKGNPVLNEKGNPVLNDNLVLNQKRGLLERASDFYSNNRTAANVGLGAAGLGAAYLGYKWLKKSQSKSKSMKDSNSKQRRSSRKKKKKKKEKS